MSSTKFARKAAFFASFGKHAFYKHNNRSLMAIGKNGYFQCGVRNKLNEEEVLNYFVEVPLFKPFSRTEIKFVSTGYYHTIFQTVADLFFGTGWNQSGKPGIGMFSDHTLPAPVKRATELKITKCCCGGDSSYFLNASGESFSCGYNKSGQLGLGHYDNIHTMQQIMGLAQFKITEIVGGSCNVFFFSKCWKLFAAGSLEPIIKADSHSYVSTPQELVWFPENGMRVNTVYATSHCTFFMLTDGRVVAGGRNSFGIFGIGGTTSGDPHSMPSQNPVLCKNIQNVKSAAAGGMNDKSTRHSTPFEVVSLRNRNIIEVIVTGRTSYIIDSERNVLVFKEMGVPTLLSKDEIKLDDYDDFVSNVMIYRDLNMNIFRNLETNKSKGERLEFLLERKSTISQQLFLTVYL